MQYNKSKRQARLWNYLHIKTRQLLNFYMISQTLVRFHTMKNVLIYFVHVFLILITDLLFYCVYFTQSGQFYFWEKILLCMVYYYCDLNNPNKCISWSFVDSVYIFTCFRKTWKRRIPYLERRRDSMHVRTCGFYWMIWLAHVCTFLFGVISLFAIIQWKYKRI